MQGFRFLAHLLFWESRRIPSVLDLKDLAQPRHVTPFVPLAPQDTSGCVSPGPNKRGAAFLFLGIVAVFTNDRE